ncbi:hypothetical protein [Streptosporangium roseum]|uniref:hypothetical protein n=1 Tax=Streptosporangium roseum TaxID=2001 RepID=UPI0012DFE852|nr:hypothetical protein [Streptosporangium roseum]
MIFDVRPGVCKKSAQIAHSYGVQPGSARHRPCRTPEEEQERDAFRNLIFLCLAHHAEVDDKKTDADLYPPELLFEWKRKHEEEHGKNLARIRNPMTDDLIEALPVEAFEPPVTRLERIAEQSERTGSPNIDALQDLRQITSVMNDAPIGVDNLTAVASPMPRKRSTETISAKARRPYRTRQRCSPTSYAPLMKSSGGLAA